MPKTVSWGILPKAYYSKSAEQFETTVKLAIHCIRMNMGAKILVWRDAKLSVAGEEVRFTERW